MKNKLLIYLDILNTDELFRLQRFIQSKFFNNPKEKRLRQLFAKLKKTRKPGQAFCDIDIKKTDARPVDFSDLLKLVKKYIAFTELEQDEKIRNRLLLRGLQGRIEGKAEEQKNNARKQIELILSKGLMDCSPERQKNTQEVYEHELLLLQQKFGYFMVHHNRDKRNNKVLQELVNSIDRYYALLKIHYISSMNDYNMFNNYEFNYGATEIIKSIVNKFSIDAHPLLHARYSYYVLSQEDTPESFKKHKEIIYACELDKTEKKQFFDRLINYTRMKTRTTISHFWYEQLMDIYKEFFEQGYALAGVDASKNKISPQHYINYIQLLFDFDLLDEAEKFKQKYQNKRALDSRNREFIRLFDKIVETRCLDMEALENMERKLATIMREPDIFYRIIFGVLAIKTCYNCNNRAFSSKREKFRDYVRHHKQLGSDFKKLYLNFSKFTYRLHRFQQKNLNNKSLDWNNLEKLQEDINAHPVVERLWFTKKINELLTKK